MCRPTACLWTTAPKPVIVKERSTGKRGRPKSGLSGTSTKMESMARRSSSSPVPVSADTAIVGEPERTVPSRTSSMSAVDEFQPFLVHQIGLRDHDDAALDTHKIEDGQVLPSLGA